MDKDKLITKEDFAQGLNLQKLKIAKLAPAIMKLLKLEKVNAIYSDNAQFEGGDFAEHIIKGLGIEYEVSDEDLQNIPKNEPFIAVANHPYGGVDGMIMISIFSKARPDFKVMANFLLQQIPQLKEFVVSVNPFEKSAKQGMNISGIKRSLQLIGEGHPIGIFPAGEVSALKLSTLKISDKMWNPVVGKMMLKSGVKVVPVYFSGHNSVTFNLLGLVHPMLRTAKLPSELFNKKDEKIKVRIGKPISIKTIQEFTDPNDLLRFVRAKTYALGSSLDVPTFFEQIKEAIVLNEPKPIIDETPHDLILQDIERSKQRDLVFKQDHFCVFMSGAKHIPNVLREISRLREITFRAVGEGTNKPFDTDEYDIHYKHLFIWDDEAQKIVGAYRIGLGDVLYRRYKKKGFYLNELFKISKDFTPILKNSLELGRSFITLEYQRKPLSLVLLWKGVNEFLRKEQYRYRYLIGPVSISNSFSDLSKDLLVDFITKHHFDTELSKMVTPRKRYSYQYEGEGKALMEMDVPDMKVLDGLIADIEQSQMKVPVLLKKYLKQNAKIIAFNVDPKFNNALDGFLVMDVSEVPEDTFEMVMR
ncbi:MAG: lysophospholipid acyltransferase family protein [Bacteroidia bacterium]|jgi:putative hemolysin|nr:lysophospholipid acyltransferase family protein [Bacteroidia bacterium]